MILHLLRKEPAKLLPKTKIMFETGFDDFSEVDTKLSTDFRLLLMAELKHVYEVGGSSS